MTVYWRCAWLKAVSLEVDQLHVAAGGLVIFVGRFARSPMKLLMRIGDDLSLHPQNKSALGASARQCCSAVLFVLDILM